MNVPWLSKEEIARRAREASAAYAAMTGAPVVPPVPVEDMVERFFGLNLAYEDLEETLGIDDVLGATYVESRRIVVNSRLLEEGSEGRLVFTCAHETGHWVLHRHLVSEAARSGETRDAVVCRAADACEPLEWQADYFAACLLMPCEETEKAFSKVFPDGRVVFENVKSALGATALCVDPCAENWHFIADIVREEAGFSNVSKAAMIFRLEELGLVVNRTAVPLGW
jgi:Zn-dependent peptidase ImmA (M78 family)